MEESAINESTDFVIVPLKEYDELIRARMGIDLIGTTLNTYGGDDRIVVAVCRLFGYEFKEEKPDAE